MSLETEHRRHHTEPTPHPDEPQPTKWTGRRREYWSADRIAKDLKALVIPEEPTGQRRKA